MDALIAVIAVIAVVALIAVVAVIAMVAVVAVVAVDAVRKIKKINKKARCEMFSKEQKIFLAGEVEKLILGLNHPEMPKDKPMFFLKVTGKEDWSWADIEPNWKFGDGNKPGVNPWNEIAREVL